jgi:hypothetical protein
MDDKTAYEADLSAQFVDWAQTKITEYAAQIGDPYAPLTHVQREKLEHDISVLRNIVAYHQKNPG